MKELSEGDPGDGAREGRKGARGKDSERERERERSREMGIRMRASGGARERGGRAQGIEREASPGARVREGVGLGPAWVREVGRPGWPDRLVGLPPSLSLISKIQKKTKERKKWHIYINKAQPPKNTGT